MAHRVLRASLMRLMSMVILVAACGGGTTHGPTTTPAAAVEVDTGPQLQPQIGALQWYRAVSTCAQGPFEVEVPATGNKWGEEYEFRIATPHKIKLHAVAIVDGAEVTKIETVLDRNGETSGAPDNTKCIADARERLVLGRTGGGGGTPGTPGTPIVPGQRVPAGPPPSTPANVPLEMTGEPEITTPSTVIHVRLPTTPPAGARIRFRFWSIEPNDLTGVAFGAVRIAWRPNIPEVEYEAYLVRVEAERVRGDQERNEARERELQAARVRFEAELEAERIRNERAREEARKNYRPPPPVDPRVLEARRRAYEEAERARLRAEEAERLRAEEAARRERLRLEEAQRRLSIEIALKADRERRRREWCDAHHESRDCWGAGGYKVHAEMKLHDQERTQYCEANPVDARCWKDDDWKRRREVWEKRVAIAVEPPKPPDGPPPAPLADAKPPKLSENATWRDGYWQWLDGTWVWLAGQWRVPDTDIEQDKTTRAPSAPPPPQTEVIAVAPVRTAVWVSGFWMWNGTQWIWFPGSWQLRPSASVRWRAPEWRARGSIHVLVPGGWIRGSR